MAGQLGQHPSWVNTTRGRPSAIGEGQEGHGNQWGQEGRGARMVPGPQLVLAAPHEVPELLVVGVVVVLDSEEHGSGDLHQRVIGRLLLLPTGVAVVEVVDLVSYLWKEPRGQDLMKREERDKQGPWQEEMVPGMAASPLGAVCSPIWQPGEHLAMPQGLRWMPHMHGAAPNTPAKLHEGMRGGEDEGCQHRQRQPYPPC